MDMKKQSGLEHIIGDFKRRFGSVSGPTAPAFFRNIGGPLTGSLAQALVLGGLGYGGGQLVGRLSGRRLDPHRTGMAGALALGGLGPLLNLPGLSRGYHAAKNVPLRDKLRTMNIDWAKWADPKVRARFIEGAGEHLPVTEQTRALRNAEWLNFMEDWLSGQRGDPERPSLSPATPRRSQILSEAIRPYTPEPSDQTLEYLGQRAATEYPSYLKMGSAKRADVDYGLAGGMNLKFDTFLPPGRQSFGFPAHYTIQQIENDPYMGPMAKAKAVYTIRNASNGKSGLIGWGDVARAGVGAGMGYAGAKLFGKVLDGTFGGLAPKTHKRLQAAGVIAGLLMNTGVLK